MLGWHPPNLPLPSAPHRGSSHPRSSPKTHRDGVIALAAGGPAPTPALLVLGPAFLAPGKWGDALSPPRGTIRVILRPRAEVGGTRPQWPGLVAPGDPGEKQAGDRLDPRQQEEVVVHAAAVDAPWEQEGGQSWGG